ncbi:PAS domain-containing sensor histidine kinase [Piscinibacter sp. HJYY11]|uniref:PAS domain-containing sensor histidine kinase n=1 Tax=Piscinibacter sp. HJYY11 TaxID=2801333 RepID=UPI00191F6D4D|nr:PAS domain S-box protein [Piscinibacter sp. HJYY11]MBL0726459.1 PAS domain S-box protein [Piscinibacter sp. HJYY11]
MDVASADTPFDAATLFAQELPDACVVLTLDGRVAHWSRGAQATFGYDSSEAVGHSVHDLVVPLDRVAEQQKALSDIVGQGTITYESVRRRKDGTMLCVDVTAKLLSSSGEGSILMSEKDVTDIKVQRDAKLMEARFRELLESTPDGIVMANPTGHIVIANSQAESLFGYEPGELRGKPVDILLPERYRRAHVGHRSNYFLQPRKRAMGSGLDLSGVRKDGTEFPIEISLSPLRTEENAFVMSAIRDISERKRFERALQEKNLELATANQAKDRFLASMSHELRTPLNAIIGFTGTLLMGLPGPLTPDQYKQLRTVQSSARHLLALINDLLDVAKIEAGKVDLALTPIDCCAVIDEVAATLKIQAEAKGLKLNTVVPPTPLMWTTDRRALHQIVLNLAGNAVKFTDTGSVTLNLREHEGVLEVVVHDTGVGIPLEEQSKLFAPFSQAGSMRPRAAEGTGLGLHLSQRLAELLGGHIAFESEPGEGSRFTLRLQPQPAAT